MDATAPLPEDMTLGDPASPVGLCTLWTRQERILRAVPRELYALCGNLYSLWGINLVVQTVLARPTLRYLVVCGVDYAESGRALLALVEEGITPERRIVGFEVQLEAGEAAVARFRAQVTAVDLRGCTSGERVAAVIRALPTEPGPGPAVIRPAGAAPRAAPGTQEQAGRQAAEARPRRPPGPGAARFQPDPLGNFLIAVGNGEIVAAHATTTAGPSGQRFTGRTAAEVYRAILAAGLVSQLDHAAYLGAELARAEMALQAGLPYRQDRPPRLPPSR